MAEAPSVAAGRTRASKRIADAIVLLGVAAPLLVGVATGGEPGSRLMLLVSLALAAAAGAAVAPGVSSDTPRRLRLGVSAVLLLGSAVWALGALGNWAMDSGLAALARQDFRRAAARFSEAAAVHEGPGVTLSFPGGADARLRVGLKGIPWYPKWLALYREAAALYGAGTPAEALQRIDQAVDSARSDGAGEETIRWLKGEARKMVRDK